MSVKAFPGMFAMPPLSYRIATLILLPDSRVEVDVNGGEGATLESWQAMTVRVNFEGRPDMTLTVFWDETPVALDALRAAGELPDPPTEE